LVREDFSTAGSNSQQGANLDAVAFNVGFILRRRPLLAVEIFKLYRQAYEVRMEDPNALKQDVQTALDEWYAMAVDASNYLS
jgi:hypothetical protein